MQSLQQIRDEEKKGERKIAAAQNEAQRILGDARAQEDHIRDKISVKMDEKEKTLTDQTIDEIKRIAAESKKDTVAKTALLQQTAADSETAAVDFLISIAFPSKSN